VSDITVVDMETAVSDINDVMLVDETLGVNTTVQGTKLEERDHSTELMTFGCEKTLLVTEMGVSSEETAVEAIASGTLTTVLDTGSRLLLVSTAGTGFMTFDTWLIAVEGDATTQSSAAATFSEISAVNVELSNISIANTGVSVLDITDV